MNQNLLKSKMALVGHFKNSDLCEVLGLSVPGLMRKLDGSFPFKSTEIQKMIDAYALTPDDVHEIFFNNQKEGG